MQRKTWKEMCSAVRILDEPPVPQFCKYLMDSSSLDFFFYIYILQFSERSAKTKVIVILVTIKT